MQENNTPENVLRFMQLRPPTMIDPVETVQLEGGSAFAKALAKEPLAERAKAATAFLEGAPRSAYEITNSPTGCLVLAALQDVLTRKGPVGHLREAFDKLVESVSSQPVASE